MAKCTITLTDGTKVTANLNMNTFESDTEPDDGLFENNTDNVSYEDEEGNTTELGDCRYLRGIKDDNGKYLFFLNPLTEEEKLIRLLRKNNIEV